MNAKIANIDGKSRDVISEQEYNKNYMFYEENLSIQSGTAVEVVNPADGAKYILPFRGRNDDRPGIYSYGAVYQIRYPDPNNIINYRSENVNVIDFSDIKSIGDFLEKNDQVRQMEVNSLTDSDDVFIPPVSGKESREMKAMKDAIVAKHFDINKYSARFGDNFLNDKRILKSDSITMNKFKAIADILDIEAELILRDKSDSVPNPMGKEIRVVLTKKENGQNDGNDE